MEFKEVFEDLVSKTKNLQQDIEDNDYEQQLLNEKIRISIIAHQGTTDSAVRDYLDSTLEEDRDKLRELKNENADLQNEYRYYSKIVGTLQAVYQRQ